MKNLFNPLLIYNQQLPKST